LPSGQIGIGYHYEKGIGIEKDPKKAFYWYEKAAIMETYWLCII
jgi:TPR repeat protein